jgi:hypothetical protein
MGILSDEGTMTGFNQVLKAKIAQITATLMFKVFQSNKDGELISKQQVDTISA